MSRLWVLRVCEKYPEFRLGKSYRLLIQLHDSFETLALALVRPLLVVVVLKLQPSQGEKGRLFLPPRGTPLRQVVPGVITHSSWSDNPRSSSACPQHSHLHSLATHISNEDFHFLPWQLQVSSWFVKCLCWVPTYIKTNVELNLEFISFISPYPGKNSVISYLFVLCKCIGLVKDIILQVGKESVGRMERVA